MAIPFMAYNMAIGKTPTGGDWAVDRNYNEPERCVKCHAPRTGKPEARICEHVYGEYYPLDNCYSASGGAYWNNPIEEEDYNYLPEIEHFDHSMEIETMRANERMGAALAYCYLKYPNLKQEVVEFLDDYPFTF